MSLIRIRHERRATGPGRAKRPPSPVRLVLLLVIVAGLIWWLARFAG